MTTRGTTTYDTYPWEDDAPLVAGAFEDSGIIENLKRLENQLRAVTIVAYNNLGNFSTNEGVINCLYQNSTMPSWTVSGITHSGYTISHVKDWIDALRSDYGIAAWSWSTDFLNGGVMKLNHIKEAWMACGTISSVIRPYVGLNDYVVGVAWQTTLSFYYFARSYIGIMPLVRRSTPQQVLSRSVLEIGEATRKTNTSSLILLTAHYIDDAPGTVSFCSSTYNFADPTGTWNSASALISGIDLIDGAGEGVSNYSYLDITSFHPTAGSGNIYYQFKFDTETLPFADTWYLRHWYPRATSGAPYDAAWLWQPELVNPY